MNRTDRALVAFAEFLRKFSAKIIEGVRRRIIKRGMR